MTSIPPERLARIADSIAFELGLPWRVTELRAEALKAYRAVERRAASAGLSSEQASERAPRHVHEEVLRAARKPTDQAKPAPEQIETALEVFTVKQWTPVEPWPPIALSPAPEDWPVVESRFGLMGCLGRMEVEALLDHIRHDEGDLAQRIGARKLAAIEGRAIERHTELTLPDDRDKLVPVSDPYRANVWRELARTANLEGKGRPARGGSVAELGSNNSIARRLSKWDAQTGREMRVDDREVKRWHERMERLPFEQYVTDVGADDEETRAAAFIDYYTMIRRKYRRKN